MRLVAIARLQGDFGKWHAGGAEQGRGHMEAMGSQEGRGSRARRGLEVAAELRSVEVRPAGQFVHGHGAQASLAEQRREGFETCSQQGAEGAVVEQSRFVPLSGAPEQVGEHEEVAFRHAC